MYAIRSYYDCQRQQDISGSIENRPPAHHTHGSQQPEGRVQAHSHMPDSFGSEQIFPEKKDFQDWSGLVALLVFYKRQGIFIIESQIRVAGSQFQGAFIPENGPARVPAFQTGIAEIVIKFFDFDAGLGSRNNFV